MTLLKPSERAIGSRWEASVDKCVVNMRIVTGRR